MTWPATLVAEIEPGHVREPSPLSNSRNIVDVICAYANRNTDFTEKFFVRSDITEAFPFLVTKL